MEEKILELLEAEYDCRRGTQNSFEVLYHLSHLRGNLTEWLPVKDTETVLEFGADTGQLTGGLLGKAKRVVCLEEREKRRRILQKRYEKAGNLTILSGNPWEALKAQEESGYDWIVAPGLLSQAVLYFSGEQPEVQALQAIRKYLKPEGHLVLTADNRFGLKYWAGAMAPHTGNYFDGLTGNGPFYSKKELERILEAGGCEQVQFYYPYPGRWFPSAIYSDAWLPKAGELNQNLRNFEGERLVLFDEEKVYDRLIADGRFPEFSNAYLCVVGPKMEEEILFSKYSNDRAEAFCIRTDIVKTTEGMEVRKVPVSEAAKKHVRDMKDWEEVLDRLYKKNHIIANRCELRGGIACFEFLKGRTLEEHLDELRRQKDYAGLTGELLKFRALLFETLKPELTAFEKGDAFREMFGAPAFTRAYEGAPVNNLDWIFGNLMETKEGLQIIDYEWTFPVQVPVEYLLWRALSLYLASREDLKHLGLLSQMGITEEEEVLFSEMEHCFQIWLLQGTVPIGAQYLATAGRTIPLSQMVERANKNRMQVYTDMGSGFSEAESRWVTTEPDKRGLLHLELLLPEGTKALRLDPAEHTCLVSVKRLLGELSGTYPLNWTHNGRELEERGILYTTTDPQILIPEIVPGTRRIYVQMTVEELYPDTAYACMNLLNRVRKAERFYESRPVRWLLKLKKMLR
ncbi:MAG: hypothetical protein HFI92_02110 [Lachnospiraceae bacterium]|nr:hypothetical protein [Lachnospiraceae bacterium]